MKRIVAVVFFAFIFAAGVLSFGANLNPTTGWQPSSIPPILD